jgi:hypothetical protein
MLPGPRALARGTLIMTLIGLASTAVWVWRGKAAEYFIGITVCVVIACGVARISYRRFVRRMAEKLNYRITENWRARR